MSEITNKSSDIISKKFLDKEGLRVFWANILQSFSSKEHEHDYLPLEGTAINSNDLTGSIESTYEEFYYRVSANDKLIKDNCANIRNIYGNSLEWNQKIRNTIDTVFGSAIGWHVRQGADNAEIIGDSIRFNFVSGVSDYAQISQEVNFVDGHKYSITMKWLLNGELDGFNRAFRIRTTNDIYGNQAVDFISDILTTPTLSGVASVFFTPTNNAKYITIEPRKLSNDIGQYAEICVKITDVTQMFGSDNEPTTVEEFYKCLPEGININVYNEGEMINFAPKAIETIEFNQWDEEWVNGYIDVTPGSNGNLGTNNSRIASENFCACLPNTLYYIKAPEGINIIWFTAEKKVIKYDYTRGLVTSPSNAAYFKINAHTTYGNTYKNDICVNISCDRNSEYKSYKKSEISLSWIKNYFTNGMKSIGDVYDEVRYNELNNCWEAVQRVGEVDLGSLDWTYDKPFGGTTTLFYTTTNSKLENIKTTTDISSIANILCTQYSATSVNTIANTTIDKAIAAHTLSGYKKIFVADASYTDDETFEKSMEGVKLYFELAEPIITPISSILMNYNVYNYGTERIVEDSYETYSPTDNKVITLITPTTPFKGTIVYQFDAIDRINTIESNLNSSNSILTDEDINLLVSKNFLLSFGSDSGFGISLALTDEADFEIDLTQMYE